MSQRKLDELWQRAASIKQKQSVYKGENEESDVKRKRESGSSEKRRETVKRALVEPAGGDKNARKKSPGEQVLENQVIFKKIVGCLSNPFNLFHLRGLLSLHSLKFLKREDLKDHLARRYLSLACGLHLKPDEPVPYDSCKNMYIGTDMNEDDWALTCEEHCLDYEEEWTRENFEKSYGAMRYVPRRVFECGTNGSKVMKVYNGGKFSESDVYKEFDCPDLCINYACESGLPARIVRKLFKETGLSVDDRDQDDQSCLHHACLRGHYGLVRYLVDLGLKCEVNPVYFADKIDESTPLMYACISGIYGIVKYLVEEGGADVADKDFDGQTPLSIACQNNHVRVVRYLIRTGEVDVNCLLKDVCLLIDERCFAGETLLGVQVACGRNEIAKLLIKEGRADLENTGGQGQTPFVIAAAFGNLEMIRYMAEHCSVDVESRDAMGRGAILHAAKFGDVNVLKYLIETAKLRPDVKDQKGKTALDYALLGKDKDTIDYLKLIL